MSRTFEALKRAERRSVNGSPGSSPVAAVNGRRAPVITPNGDGNGQVEYERIRAWITSPPPPQTRLQTVLVTGCQGGSGATTTAVRLATTLAAQPGVKVLLVDANVRRPCLDLVFGVPATPGLRQALTGDGAGWRPLSTTSPNLFVLPAGQGSGGSPDVFQGSAVERLLAGLRPGFDHIVLDTAPLLDFPDAQALVRHVDAVVLVVESDRTPVDAARRAARDLEQIGARRVGVVLNRQHDYVPRLLRRLLGRRS